MKNDLEDKAGTKERRKAAVQEAVTVDATASAAGIRPSIGVEVLNAMLDFRVHHAREAISEYAYYNNVL